MKHLFIFLLILIANGCCSLDHEEYKGNPEFKPLPPEKLHDLLHKESANIAYKSVTKEDYEAKDEC